MTQTPIQRAIEQISQYRDTYNPMCDEFTMIDNCVEKLTDLLPYEREVIGKAYSCGKVDGFMERSVNFHDSTKYTKPYDYFTKTFTNNAD